MFSAKSAKYFLPAYADPLGNAAHNLATTGPSESRRQDKTSLQFHLARSMGANTEGGSGVLP